jgi:hypothetical protein
MIKWYAKYTNYQVIPMQLLTQYNELAIGHFFRLPNQPNSTVYYKMSRKKVFNTTKRTIELHHKNNEVEDLGLTYPEISLMTFAEVPLDNYFQFMGKNANTHPVFRKIGAFTIRPLGSRNTSVYKQKKYACAVAWY